MILPPQAPVADGELAACDCVANHAVLQHGMMSALAGAVDLIVDALQLHSDPCLSSSTRPLSPPLKLQLGICLEQSPIHGR